MSTICHTRKGMTIGGLRVVVCCVGMAVPLDRTEY